MLYLFPLVFQPDNVLMSDAHSDQLRLCDFGNAVELTPGEAQYCKYGSPEFVGPEIVNQSPVSTATDIWYGPEVPGILPGIETRMFRTPKTFP